MTNTPQFSGGEDNLLLLALPTRERNAVHRVSTRFKLQLGETLFRRNVKSKYAFFPICGVISLIRLMTNGASIEVGLVGREGIVGVDVFTGARVQLNEGIVQGEGSAWRMPADHLVAQFRKQKELQHQLLRFTDAFITQISQTAACNGTHAVEARLARWLLMMHDRVATDQITLTQQFLGHMLGARTASVNEAIQRLEAADVIGHKRQQITVVDRKGLEAMACECYTIVRRVYELSLKN